MIPRDIIDKINDLPILEVLQKVGFEVKQKGVNYQALCPFHNEKTGSFVISPRKNIYKCFGCGEAGGPVSFVMKYEKKDFIDAVRFLGKAFNIDIPREPMSEEQIKEYRQRETLNVVNETCQKYFLENLTGAALDYVKSRWNNQTVEQWGIGFAPDTWHGLDEWSRKNALKRDALINAGLLSENEKNQVYDTFRNRIIFPVHNHYGRIIGFSGRILGDGEPKYINTKETASFIKNQALFGIFLAYKSIREKGFAYLVEGGPDVIKMHQVGAENTVAPLGTGLTENHLTELSRYCKRAVFVLETDEAGIKAVIRNAQMAVKLGFTASVLALPEEVDKDGKRIKHDPDSFFTSKKQFDEYSKNHTFDFILWYSERMLVNGDQNNRAKVIDDICELLAKQTDKGTLEFYYHNLSALVKPKRMWIQKVEALTKQTEVKEEVQKLPKSIDQEHFQKYGFYEENNSVFFSTKYGIQKGSNFCLQPLFHVSSVTNSKRLYKIKNEHGFEQIIELKQDELINLSKFKVRVESLGNYLWYLGEIDLGRYKSWLYEKTDTCYEIIKMGWQKEGFWAWGNGIFTDKFIETDSNGIVNDGKRNYYLPAFSNIWNQEESLFQFERKFIHQNKSSISLYDYAESLIKVFGDNAIIGLCYVFASIYRDIIFRTTKFFPILNGFGPKGAGKSALGHSLTAFFVFKNIPPNLNNSTIPALADVVSQSANTVVHIDEYKNSVEFEKIEFLKGLWDGAGRTRMNMDRDKKRETTTVDCGVYLSGQEMPTIDIALFSRLIFITFHKTEYSDNEKKYFNQLREIEKNGLTHLTNQLILLRGYVDDKFLEVYNECTKNIQDKLKGETIEDRIFRNWLVILTAYKCIADYITVPFTYSTVLDLCIAGIKLQNGETKRNNELSNFWSIVEYLVKEGLLENEIDFYIRRVNKLKTDKVNIEEFKEEKTILELNHTKVFQLYRKHGKIASDKVLPISTIQYYLQNSKEYLGIKKSVAFKNRDAITKQIKEENFTDNYGVSHTVKKYQVTNAYVFDYEMLGISIDYISVDDDEAETEPKQLNVRQLGIPIPENYVPF